MCLAPLHTVVCLLLVMSWNELLKLSICMSLELSILSKLVALITGTTGISTFAILFSRNGTSITWSRVKSKSVDCSLSYLNA